MATVPKFETKDSGARAVFDSGMQRDTEAGKPRFDLMFPLDVPYDEQMLTRLAALYGRGSVKYDARNWEKANSVAEMERMKSSAFRHFMQWFCGESDEDHAAGAMFNIIAFETTAYKVAQQSADAEVTALGDELFGTLPEPDGSDSEEVPPLKLMRDLLPSDQMMHRGTAHGYCHGCASNPCQFN